MIKSKVFLDTNVVMDFVAQREPFNKYADQIFLLIQHNKIQGFTSALSISTTQFIIERLFSKSKCLEVLKLLTNILEIISFEKDDIEKSLFKKDFIDMEDLFQYHMALKANMDCIVTRDKHGFDKKGKVKIYMPEEFLTTLTF